MIYEMPKTVEEALQRGRTERSRVFLNGLKGLRASLRSALTGRTTGRTA